VVAAGALKLIHSVEIRQDRARVVEQKLHKEINHLRVRGEWFNISDNFAKEIIDYAVIRYEDDALL
jgi:hypothetical protein